MKKIMILTTLLSLTACGGGSGTKGLTPAESNARVTGMNSFVIIGGSNPTINTNARIATMGILQSDGGFLYNLENVSFKSIPTSGVIDDLIFHTDSNGRIRSIEYPNALAIMEEHDGSEVPVGELMRQGDTNEFRWQNMPIYYESYAEQSGLNYSDFGILKFDATGMGDREYDVPFAGGYNIKKVENNRMRVLAEEEDPEKIVFTGLAKGQVSHSDIVNNTDIALEGGLIDNAATLTFESDGTQTLAANFTNWAKIEAVKNADNTNEFRVIESYVDDTSPFYLESSTAVLYDGVMGIETMAFQTGYYGDDDAPNEAVSLLQYQYMKDYNGQLHDYQHHTNVDLGFGGIK